MDTEEDAREVTDRLGLVGSADCLHGCVPRSVDGVDDGLVGIGCIQSFCCRLTSVGDQTTINTSRTCQSTRHTCQSTRHTCQSHLSTWRSDYNRHITHLSINLSHLSITPVYLAIRLQSTRHAPVNQLITPVNHTCLHGH